jgi:hypothetical protein
MRYRFIMTATNEPSSTTKIAVLEGKHCHTSMHISSMKSACHADTAILHKKKIEAGHAKQQVNTHRFFTNSNERRRKMNESSVEPEQYFFLRKGHQDISTGRFKIAAHVTRLARKRALEFSTRGRHQPAERRRRQCRPPMGYISESRRHWGR